MKKVSAFCSSWPGAILLALVGLSSAAISFIYGNGLWARETTAAGFIVFTMALVLMMVKTINYYDGKVAKAKDEHELQQKRLNVTKLLTHIAFRYSLDDAKSAARKICLKLRPSESVEIPRDVIELSSPSSLGAAIGTCCYKEIRNKDEATKYAYEIVKILHGVVGDCIIYFEDFQDGITSRHPDHLLCGKIMPALEARQIEIRSHLAKEQDDRELQEVYTKGLQALHLQ